MGSHGEKKKKVLAITHRFLKCMSGNDTCYFDFILLAERSHMATFLFKRVVNFILNICIEDDKTEYLTSALLITTQCYEGGIYL